MRERKRSTARQGYAKGYVHARRRILGPAGNGALPTDPPCHWCGAVATTADHEPPMAVCGYEHLNLVPACRKCNYGRRGRELAPARASPSRSW